MHAIDSPGPFRIASRAASWPLHDRAASRSCEAQALAQSQPQQLMARAGRSVARLVMALAPEGGKIEFACGPGNNGGDGLVAARWLHQLGRRVRVLLFDAEQARPADAGWALEQARASGVPMLAVDPTQALPPAADLHVDALLGLGASRALAGGMAAWAAARRGSRLLAIDLPSGLNIDTGQPWGGPSAIAVAATHTLSLLTLKPGLFTASGRDHCGEIWFDTLGVPMPSVPSSASLLGREDALPRQAQRPHASHKGSFGDVVVVGGANGMTGAAALAGGAALAAGAGRVYLSLLADAGQRAPLARIELMQRDNWWQAPARDIQAATLLAGCGGGKAIADALVPLLGHAARAVIDADGLNAAAEHVLVKRLVAGRRAKGQVTVLTPHPLEAARLLMCSTAEVMNDRLAAARRLAEMMQSIVVLKGSGTVIAAPGAGMVINPSGNALLATAGTGDVLAGWIAGRWSAESGSASPWAGAPPDAQTRSWLEAMKACFEACWLHGHAADRVLTQAQGAHGPLRASELIEHMGSARAELLR